MITLHNQAFTVTINPFGAELHSVIVNGEERLWQGDPSVWSGRAPILFPVAGSFLNHRYIYDGVSYDMPQHGFARKRAFAIRQQSDTAVTLTLDGREDNYPFDYCLSVSFELPRPNQAALQVTYEIENRGQGDMYYGIGAHEAYACPEGVEHYHLVFPQDKALTNHLLTGAQRNYQTEEIALGDGKLTLKPALFANDGTLVLPGLQSRTVILQHNDGKRFVRVDFESFDNLLLWQKTGAKYLCIEPWSHAPEFTDHDGELTHKPGVRCLPAKQSDFFTHTITFG